MGFSLILLNLWRNICAESFHIFLKRNVKLNQAKSKHCFTPVFNKTFKYIIMHLFNIIFFTIEQPLFKSIDKQTEATYTYTCPWILGQHLVISNPPAPLPPKPCSFCCLASLAECVCIILFNDIMDLNLLSLSTLVPVSPCCVFHATKHQIYWRFEMNDMVSASTLIWYHTQDTQGPIMIHLYKYILTSPVKCT